MLSASTYCSSRGKMSVSVAGAAVGSLAVDGGDRFSDLDLTFGIADDVPVTAALDDWTAASIEEDLRGLADELGQKPRQAFAPIRLAVTGSKVSPGLFESIELLGRERTLQRLAAAYS